MVRAKQHISTGAQGSVFLQRVYIPRSNHSQLGVAAVNALRGMDTSV